MGIGVGLVMALIFDNDDPAHDRATDALFAEQSARPMPHGIRIEFAGKFFGIAAAFAALRHIAWKRRSMDEGLPASPARGDATPLPA